MSAPDGFAVQQKGVVKKQSHFRHYMVVLACLMMCFAPSAFAFSVTGIFYVPITEYLQIPMTTFAVTMTIESIAVIIVLPFVGRFLKSGDARLVLVLAVLCLGGSLLWRSFATQLWEWYVTAAIMGVGVSITLYLATPTLVGRWFEDKVGFFVGLCMAFTGIGGVVFNTIGGLLIASGPDGWRTAYLVFAIVCVVLTIPFILAVRSYPSDVGLLPYRSKNAEGGEKVNAVVLSGVTSSKALKLPGFWILAIFAAFITLVSVILNYMPSYVASFKDVYPETAAMVTWIASITMVGAVVGKIAIGAVSDKNIKYGLALGLSCGYIGIGLLWLIPSSVIAVVLGAFLFGICFASATVQLPMMARYLLGSLDYTTIYARISIAASIAGAVGAIFWGALVDGPGFFALMGVLMGFIAICTVTGYAAIAARKNIVFEEQTICELQPETSKNEV